MKIGRFLKTHGIAAALGSALMMGAAASVPVFAQDAPKQEELKKHETSPGGQYQPSLDVLKGEKLEQPGTKPGDPARAQRIADAGRAFVEAQLSYAHLAVRMATLLAEPWPIVAPLTGWRAFCQRLGFI